MPNNNKVTFDEPGMDYARGPRGPRVSWPTKLVMSLGLAKNPKQATTVLLVIGIVAVALAFTFWPRDEFELVPQPGLESEAVSYLN